MRRYEVATIRPKDILFTFSINVKENNVLIYLNSLIYLATLITLHIHNWKVETTFSFIILILGTLCDVVYECLLNSTVKLRINQLLSALI